jgi:DNA primase
MLRKRVAELAGLSQAELEERLEVKASRRVPEVVVAVHRRSTDRYAKLLERVLAEPKLIRDLWPLDLPASVPATAEASALFGLIDESRTLGQELTLPGMMELLRLRGHDAILQRLLPIVRELQMFTVEELRIEVEGAIQGLRTEAEKLQITQASLEVSSPQDLSEEARALLRRAPDEGKAVKFH